MISRKKEYGNMCVFMSFILCSVLFAKWSFVTTELFFIHFWINQKLDFKMLPDVLTALLPLCWISLPTSTAVNANILYICKPLFTNFNLLSILLANALKLLCCYFLGLQFSQSQFIHELQPAGPRQPDCLHGLLREMGLSKTNPMTFLQTSKC